MERRFSGVFWKIYEAAKLRPRYISNRGGTRSGKTYSTIQFLHELIQKADGPGDVTSVVSETLPHLKRGAVRDFERNLGHPLKQDFRWNASELVYTYDNGAKIEFFSADAPNKVKGPSRKRLFINEANHIPYETARQLFVRTTGLILIDYNPESVFWGIEEIEPRSNCAMIVTTYQDNLDFLSKEQIAEIEANMKDANWWKVYGRGEIGSLEGLIYDFTQIDAMPTGDEATSLVEVYGMDFGFTNDPTTLIRLLVDTRRKIVYADERLFRTGMKNPMIVEAMRADKVPAKVPVYADCAEPKSIAEIKDGGFNVIACDKSAPTKSDKLSFQLQWMQGWTLKVTKASLNMIRELRNYMWAKDASGKTMNYPVGGFDHALDALRYALWTHFAINPGYGQYNISIKGKR